MSWQEVLKILNDECGADLASRIERRLANELGGVRITIAKRQTITREMADKAAPGKPREAARKLGVHPATIYRALRRPITR